MARAYAGFTLAQMKSVADGLSNQLAAANVRIAQAEAECRRLRVCGNCRHYSQGYTDDYCVKDCSHGEKETRRGNTCRDWEMI